MIKERQYQTRLFNSLLEKRKKKKNFHKHLRSREARDASDRLKLLKKMIGCNKLTISDWNEGISLSKCADRYLFLF